MNAIKCNKEKPISIGICYDISFKESSILVVKFEIDQRYFEDKGRSDLSHASFTYDFKNGLIIDWNPQYFDHIRTGDEIDFGLYYNDEMIFIKTGDAIDEINKDIEPEIIDKIHKVLKKENIQELIEAVIMEICPETDLIK